MFNVCPKCGMYSDEKVVDPQGPFAICPECGYPHPFLQLPLFVITGPSGAGKSTTCLELVPQLPECVVMESDILWRPEFTTPEDDYRSYRNLWLRVAKNSGQGGRPVVVCGTALPEHFETCPERRYFTTIHYLALVCDNPALMQRLRNRPRWRGAGTDEFMQQMVSFNDWLKTHAATTKPAMTVLDTTHQSIEQSVAFVADWVRTKLP